MPWYALRTLKDNLAERELAFIDGVTEVYYPKEQVRTTDGNIRVRPYLPHIIFVNAGLDIVRTIETRGHNINDPMPAVWVYRDHIGGDLKAIPEHQMKVLRLLTAEDSTRCEVFRKTDYKPGQSVRVIAGPFEGQVGTVQRVGRNRHVVVRIEGLCALLLPFIHPDLLEELGMKNEELRAFGL